jgi:heptosyltransferase II
MKILIVGPSWVGDMVMAQTLFQCLKQRHPECEIDVLAPEWSRPILERMPEVRKALSFPLGHGALELATRRKIGKSLKGQYDQAILLPNSTEVGAGAVFRRDRQAHRLARRIPLRPAQ